MKCGIIQKIKEQSLGDFIGDHRGHFEPREDAMDARQTEGKGIDGRPLYICRCSCGDYWVGADHITGDVCGRRA